MLYRCPDCRKTISNPLDGQYVPHNPKSDVWGFQVPQILSPDVSIGDIWEYRMEMKDQQEFWNSVIGVPHVSPTNQPINEAIFRACVNDKIRWAETANRHAYMGVDQRSGENHVIVLLSPPGEKIQIAHIELIQDDDPFGRLHGLMAQFNITCCVIDQNPNVNEAVRFAKAHMGRVFLCTYHEVPEMIRWMDRDNRPEGIRKTRYDAQYQNFVRAHRYKTIDNALALFTRREIEIPKPENIMQDVVCDGQLIPVQVALGDKDRKEPGLLLHLMSVARVQNPVIKSGPNGEQIETGDVRMEWQNLRGIDPHWLHALNYAVIATERRSDSIILTTEATVMSDHDRSKQDRQIRGSVELLKAQAGAVETAGPTRHTCGECMRFNPDRRPNCDFLNANTKATDQICRDGFRPANPSADNAETKGYIIV